MWYIKKVKTLKDYRNVIDNLVKRKIFSRYTVMSPEGMIGVDWNITDLYELKHLKTENTPIQQCILDEAITLFGKWCKDKHATEPLGILEGLLLTEEDVYWILNNNGTKHYLTCVGGIEEYENRR